jgi:NYN domain
MSKGWQTMQRDSKGGNLSAVFVDYDNIYLSLKRKNEEAAKRFSKDASLWIRAIESGQLITPTNGEISANKRRIVMNRCYGNPVPRRNTHDNSTDMNSFPFVRHHFLRAGFEIVDCPPLTAQLKNSSDIRMVMDMRDYLTHDTYFDEFIILSGDADFTPVLHRLRQHARRTVIFANDHTATPYTAICDGEVREVDLIALLLGADAASVTTAGSTRAVQHSVLTEAQPAHAPMPNNAPARLLDLRREIVAEVISGVRTSAAPIPLETLADRAVRLLGHDRTAGTNWAGAGTFRELLRQELPDDVRVSDQPPFVAYDARRQVAADAPTARQQTFAPEASEIGQSAPTRPFKAQTAPMQPAPQTATRAPEYSAVRGADSAQPLHQPASHQVVAAAPARAAMPTPVQQSIMRIYEASQAPQIAPAEYRVLFESMAVEINENALNGDTTLQNIVTRACDRGVDVHAEDVRFVLDVVGEADPWFENGASANLFAGRFRNFIVSRCREMGMKLSAAELDMIDSWFAPAVVSRAADRTGERVAIAQSQPSPAHLAMTSAPSVTSAPKSSATAMHLQEPASPVPAPRMQPARAAEPQQAASRWWALDNARDGEARPTAEPQAGEDDEMPRIVRSRARV